MNIDEFFSTVFLDNTIVNYIKCVGILLLGYLIRNKIGKTFSKVFFRCFKAFSKNKFADEFVYLLKTPFKLLFELVFIYIAFFPLSFPADWNILVFKNKPVTYFIEIFFDLLLATAITWVLLRIIDYIALVMLDRARQTEDTADDQLVSFFKELIKFLVIIFSVFFVLGAVFNLNITAFVTGLGLGGLAIALAAQETLGNLLASFIIFLDKPFKAGDLVNVSDITGTVEKVGFRSTRIRTLDKSLLTVPNKKMIDAPLNNITLSSFRRVKFNVELEYSTTATQLKTICDAITLYLQQHAQVDSDITVKFKEFTQNALSIQVTYFVSTSSWDVMMEVRQEVNYKVMEIIESNGATFAFPTHTIHLQNNK